jgi:hypothetical protein
MDEMLNFKSLVEKMCCLYSTTFDLVLQMPLLKISTVKYNDLVWLIRVQEIESPVFRTKIF